MSTAREQLEGAALSLARSGPIKERLTDAFRNHLALVNAEELPMRCCDEFRACHDALTRERPLRGARTRCARQYARCQTSKPTTWPAAWCGCLLPWRAKHRARRPLATPADAGGTLTNGSGARVKLRTGVPQVISLYAAEA